MVSVLGKNVLVGCEHFTLPIDIFLTDNFSPQSIGRMSIE